jgi:serine/threonine-protein phosphatase 5
MDPHIDNPSLSSRLLELNKEHLSAFRRLIVVGDLHGDFFSLNTVLSIVNLSKDCLIFLGDYADRGKSGVEVIEAVQVLIEKNPKSAFALKGNHEDYSEAGNPKFSPCQLIEEANEKVGDWQNYFKNKLKPFITHLHLCVVVPGEALFVHGGLSSKINRLGDLEQPTENVEEDVLWSDPFEGNGERPNPRGAGVLFGKDITLRVCEKLGFKRVVRSHEPLKVKCSGAPCYSHDRRIITTSTTTVYGGQPFILNIDPSDFSYNCYQIGSGRQVKSKIVECE